MLTAEDHARIDAAVDAAETGTAGEIFVVLAGEVSSYREVPLAWAAAVALVAPPIVLAVGVGPLVEAAAGGAWSGADVGALLPQLGAVLALYSIAQVLLFALVALIVSIPPIRRALTPRFLKRHRIARAAFHHFTAAHCHAQDSQTGVLIFIALVDRQVQVLADRAIHEKAGDPVWTAAAAAVQEGMKAPDPTAGIELAIGICGTALKTHFPSDKPHAPAHIVEL